MKRHLGGQVVYLTELTHNAHTQRQRDAGQ